MSVERPSFQSPERHFDAARGNLFAGMTVLMQGGTEEELAHAADTVLEYRCQLADRFTEYSDEKLSDATEQNIAEWIAFLQHDELLRAQKWEELSGFPMFEMTAPDDWRQQAVSYALGGEDIDPDLAEKLGIDPLNHLSEEDESGEWVIDLYDERLAKAIDDIMLFAPYESNEAFMGALERVVRKQALKLSGDMEIDTAIKVLGRHKPDSTVLSELIRLKGLYANYPDHGDGEPMTIEFTNDDNAKPEFMEALQQSLEQDDMDDLERIWVEGLLATQQQSY